MINIIVAMDEEGIIGKGNALPWKLPADMEHFREKTLGKTVLMGRNTYESIGKPLAGRKNIVLSRTILKEGNKYFFDAENNLAVTSDMDIVWKFARAGDIYVIGGVEIYKQFMNLADVIYMTQVHGNFDGDAYFPLELLDYRDWDEVETVFRDKDEKNPYAMTFRKLVRQS